jgi:hypothetical protein
MTKNERSRIRSLREGSRIETAEELGEREERVRDEERVSEVRGTEGERGKVSGER